MILGSENDYEPPWWKCAICGSQQYEYQACQCESEEPKERIRDSRPTSDGLPREDEYV